ncbi:MAG TPA: DUF5996 family protein [Terriglobia bacterium]|nr:DUF5996 family protein [Terriglobia bacterium]
MSVAQQLSPNIAGKQWPALPLEEWEDTFHTLHMWTQIVGKVRMAFTPLHNHWWNTTLYVNTSGLTTSPIPYRGEIFEIQLDFIKHVLEVRTSYGASRAVALAPKSVAAFYHEVLSALQAIGIEVEINTKPQEVPNAIPFDRDEVHHAYDAEYANRFWRILLSTHLVFEEFRARFIGKSSPVHFFWGSFDLATTRFSGRAAPPRRGVITSEAYSHECSSLGWWPGSRELKGAAFYAYTAPAPPGLGEQRVRPGAAFFHKQFGEFLLMYDDARRASSPSDEILAFAESTYEAGADLAGWDRASLERK